MEITLKFDPKKDTEKDLQTIISNIYHNNTTNNNSIPPQNTTSDAEEKIIVQVRNGLKHTKDFKEDLKRLGFKFYSKSHGKDDPHWTLNCVPQYWAEIKDNPIFNELNVWTSEGEN